jgi:KDO2-lipid IV(A) lauroyltransferase
MKAVNYIAYALIKGFLFSARFVPMRFTFWWLGLAGRIAYRFAKGRRALMLFNLEQALGADTTPEQREEIARRSFINLFISMGELLHMDTIYQRWQDHFSFEGAEIVDDIIRQGKGFFAFGGHFGGWTSMASVFYRFPDLPGRNMVARPMRNPYVQNLVEYLASKFGGEIITTRGTGELIVDRARQGHLIGLYMDQESRRDQGIFVTFFGREAASHVVPGHLAWKHDIPLIPYWIVRERPGYFHVIFREPLRYEVGPDPEENDRRVTQLIASEVERTIRRYPDQWLWAHNRWRRRPDGTKIEIYAKRKKKKRTRSRQKGEYLSSEDQAGKGRGEA